MWLSQAQEKQKGQPISTLSLKRTRNLGPKEGAHLRLVSDLKIPEVAVADGTWVATEEGVGNTGFLPNGE